VIAAGHAPAFARVTRSAKGMPGKEHRYSVAIVWSGNRGSGTSSYKAYGREHVIRAGDKPPIAGSSDPAFMGDRSRWNPEDLLVASLSACHKLWYLHLCATVGVVVTAYEDHAEGVVVEDGEKGGLFSSVVLNPEVTIAVGGDADKALALHHDAHAKCFIANSVNFPVSCQARIVVAHSPTGAAA
jgi:organic hydroperoxide reductase OsmC/OhrA